jgi:hypothetical protein
MNQAAPYCGAAARRSDLVRAGQNEAKSKAASKAWILQLKN